MADIRDILRGLDETHRAVYLETRTNMRRAYLYAHSKILPITQYEADDDKFLDFIDIQLATLFDRAGTFNHVEGNLADKSDMETSMNNKAGNGAIPSAATTMLKIGW